jgi:hypothetical protein
VLSTGFFPTDPKKTILPDSFGDFYGRARRRDWGQRMGGVESVRMESRRKWVFHKTGITQNGKTQNGKT